MSLDKWPANWSSTSNCLSLNPKSSKHNKITSTACTSPSLKSEMTSKGLQSRLTWPEKSKNKKLSDKLKSNKAVQVFSAFHFKSITSSLKNGNTISFLKFTTVKTLQILLILTFGKSLMSSRRKKTFCSKWKAWKLRMIWLQKSMRKLKRPSMKLRERSMLLEKSTLWNEIEQRFKRTSRCKGSNKWWRKRAWTHRWWRKECETEADQNRCRIWNKSENKEAICWTKIKKQGERSVTE